MERPRPAPRLSCELTAHLRATRSAAAIAWGAGVTLQVLFPSGAAGAEVLIREGRVAVVLPPAGVRRVDFSVSAPTVKLRGQADAASLDLYLREETWFSSLVAPLAVAPVRFRGADADMIAVAPTVGGTPLTTAVPCKAVRLIPQSYEVRRGLVGTRASVRPGSPLRLFDSPTAEQPRLQFDEPGELVMGERSGTRRWVETEADYNLLRGWVEEAELVPPARVRATSTGRLPATGN
ncbi:MAG: hypothetical protein AAGA56_07860, partial [Myxococcota bacterium]